MPLELNAAQMQAVTHAGGPLLVKAGPGTGKTRTLTCRIAYLIEEQGVNPAEIAALTFTHRAAAEMEERLGELLGEDCSRALFIGTFHSLGLKMVRSHYQALGFKSPPRLYDEEEQKALMEEVLGELNGGTKRPAADQVLQRIEKLLSQGDGIQGEESGYDLAMAQDRYRQQKRSEGAVDFLDLIHLPIELLNQGKGQRFQHLFVDEYQDVNAPQVKLLTGLAVNAESIMAIGDPDQAIYSFRGTNAENFLAFPDTFPGATMLHLEENYRSSVTILDASDQLIRKNPGRLEGTAPKPAGNNPDLLVDLRVMASDRAEAVFVSREIERLCGGLGRYGHESEADLAGEETNYSFADMAVLYRLNTQAREIGAALEKGGIPYQQVGKNRGAADRLERAVLACTRLSRDRSDRAAVRYLKTVGKKKALLEQPAGLLEAGRALAHAYPARSDLYLGAARTLENRLAEKGEELDEFLARAPLARREDPYDARSEKVTLSTLHASKGLEFPLVFIVGLEAGLIPYLREDEEDPETALEEERRLLYVGMTRARSRLYLIRAKKRLLFGKTLENKPSPFLQDISNNLLSFVREKMWPRKKTKESGDSQGMLF